MGGIALVAKNVKFVNLKGSIEVKNPKTGIISIGFGVSSKKTIWDNEGMIVFNGKAHFAAGDKISNKGNMTFGDNFAMHIDSTVICYEKISFGDGCEYSGAFSITSPALGVLPQLSVFNLGNLISL